MENRMMSADCTEWQPVSTPIAVREIRTSSGIEGSKSEQSAPIDDEDVQLLAVELLLCVLKDLR